MNTFDNSPTIINLRDVIPRSELIMMVEAQDPVLKEILREEQEWLGLDNVKIYLMIWDEPDNTSGDTSLAQKLTSADYGNSGTTYVIRLHPTHFKTYQQAREVIRHELYHIFAGDCDITYYGPWWLKKFLSHAAYHLIHEPRAQEYEYNSVEPIRRKIWRQHAGMYLTTHAQTVLFTLQSLL